MLSVNNLNILQKVNTDSSIEAFNLHTYKSFNASNFGYNDEMRITVQSKDVLSIPHLSYLFIAGKVENKGPDFDYNGIAHLFYSLSYELNGVQLDKTNNVGAVSTLKSYLSITRDQELYFQSLGFSHEGTPYEECYDADSGIIQILLPLRYLSGFFEDYTQLILNSVQELVLVRSKDDSNMFLVSPPAVVPVAGAENVAVLNPRFQVTEISWKLPQIKVSDAVRVQLLNIIKQNRALSIPFRSWDFHEYPALPETTSHSWTIKSTNSLLRPRFIIVYFQTNRKHNFMSSCSGYDNINLEYFQLFLNEIAYPYEIPTINFQKKQHIILYHMFCSFYNAYYNTNSNCPIFNLKNFVTKIPMICIDCSRQRDSNLSKSNSGPINIRFDFRCSENVPKRTTANCLIIYDKWYTYYPFDGNVEQAL